MEASDDINLALCGFLEYNTLYIVFFRMMLLENCLVEKWRDQLSKRSIVSIIRNSQIWIEMHVFGNSSHSFISRLSCAVLSHSVVSNSL